MANSGGKECFGRLDTVFPMGPEGLREISPACWDCPERVDCLRVAARKGEQARQLKEEVAAKHDPEGLLGVLNRWSRRKRAAEKKGG